MDGFTYFNVEDSGFLGRESFKIRFDDLSETAYASMLANKIEDPHETEAITLTLTLLDFFPQFISIDKLETEISGQKALIRNRSTEYLVDYLNFLLNADAGAKETEIDLVEFYNFSVEKNLGYLLNGDSVSLTPCIESYDVDKSRLLHSYSIRLIPAKFLPIQADNVYKFITLRETFFSKIQNRAEEIGPGISFRKQLEFAHSYFDSRQKMTGETTFEFNLKEIRYRHLLSQIEENGKRFTLPTPMSTDTSERITMIFFLETLGLLDINSYKIGSSPKYIQDITILYSVTKPAIKNKFLAKALGLTASKRSNLNETQLHLYERVYKQLAKEASFVGRPKIESQFCEIFYWLLRKTTYCLEEPSFIKERAESWLESNGQAKYVSMEDDFFLPFLHERLKDEFGDLVSKKPEKFGGEVDLMFSELPIELKVRKNQNESLLDIIDEKYKPASQAATYAAVTRLGFVVVLDLPSVDKKVTNLDSCIKVMEKEFDENEFKTLIVICIFYCNLPKPSSAKS